MKKMGRKSHLRHTNLMEALTQETGESRLTIMQALSTLSREGWIEGIAPNGMPVGNVKIVGARPEEDKHPACERWQRVMSESGMPENEQRTLLPLFNKLEDFDSEDMIHVLGGLCDLRANAEEERGRHRFLVSAQYLKGSSKLLDSLPSLVLKAFGINPDWFPSHPLYVVVAGSSNPDTVVLVENPAAFEMAITTRAVEHCAFIVTFGFGLSTSQEDYGNQLAAMVEDRFSHAISLVREGSSCPSATALLAHPNITFWGDLDLAGIQIYLRLKKQIQQVSLSGIYAPMVKAIGHTRKTHPYVAATGKQGQRAMSVRNSTGEHLVEHLLCLTSARGVDQECVTSEEIETLATFKLHDIADVSDF